jgi:hypothetical protein
MTAYASQLGVHNNIPEDLLLGSWFRRNGKRLNMVMEPAACLPWRHPLKDTRMLLTEMGTLRAQRNLDAGMSPAHGQEYPAATTAHAALTYDHAAGCKHCYD